MTFEARLDDPESKAFSESLALSAQRADALPDWRKGILGEPARIAMHEPLGVETPGGPPGERHERGGGSEQTSNPRTRISVFPVKWKQAG